MNIPPESRSRPPLRPRGTVPAILVAALGPVIAACGPSDPVADLVAESIERHGGERFLEMEVTFTFRDARFRVRRDGGRYHYERVYRDGEGRSVREVMTNDTVAMEVDGRPVRLDGRERSRIETAVNSVVYFGFLPFRLQDPAVQLRDLGDERVASEPYRRVEVTFLEEGGGVDWEDRFVYWIHRDEKTLDYLAYRYYRDGGGTRFRRAVNRREVGGLLVQDYENFTGEAPVDDIADYARLLEEDRLTLVSMVELEAVEVGDG
jgi:hypothetical protein